MTRLDVSGEGFTGTLFIPEGTGSFRGVVAFGGSGGGLGPAAAWAPALAAEGLAVCAIAFFGHPPLPSTLRDIPVEVVRRAADLLCRRADIAGVAAMGQSRGSELALLGAAHDPSFDRVVVLSGSGLSWSAYGPDGPIDAPAWRVRDEPVPYIGGTMSLPHDDVITGTPLFLDAIAKYPDAAAAAEIPIERIGGPVLAVSGEDDRMWPAAALIERARRRAEANGFRHTFQHHRYPAAGHTVCAPPGVPVVLEVSHPVDGRRYLFGGTEAGVAASRADSWPKVVEFLQGSVEPTSL